MRKGSHKPCADLMSDVSMPATAALGRAGEGVGGMDSYKHTYIRTGLDLQVKKKGEAPVAI
jgi:hypothetical protein